MAIIMVTLCKPHKSVLNFEVAGLSATLACISTITQQVFMLMIVGATTMFKSAVSACAFRTTVAAALAMIIIVVVPTLRYYMLLCIFKLLIKCG